MIISIGNLSFFIQQMQKIYILNILDKEINFGNVNQLLDFIIFGMSILTFIWAY